MSRRGGRAGRALAGAFAALLLAASAAAQTGVADGEVRRVDKAQGKLTVRHGPIEGELVMPAMSMVFRVRDPGLLDRLKPGDRGRFTIARDAGAYWIEGFDATD